MVCAAHTFRRYAHDVAYVFQRGGDRGLAPAAGIEVYDDAEARAAIYRGQEGV